jgi:hypothetical protein
MTDVTRANFGYLVAYLLPGMIVVAKASAYSETIRSWLGTSPAASPTVGGFLYVTVASIGAGMTISAIRWLILDAIHHHSGVPKPNWDFSKLPAALAAFEGAVENHYRYYQFYGNTLVAICIASIGGFPRFDAFRVNPFLTSGVSICLAVVLFVASRDALRKYYDRTGALLSGVRHRKETRHDEWLAFETEERSGAQRRRPTTRKTDAAVSKH